jgi:hypothetical protein
MIYIGNFFILVYFCYIYCLNLSLIDLWLWFLLMNRTNIGNNRAISKTAILRRNPEIGCWLPAQTCESYQTFLSLIRSPTDPFIHQPALVSHW